MVSYKQGHRAASSPLTCPGSLLKISVCRFSYLCSTQLVFLGRTGKSFVGGSGTGCSPPVAGSKGKLLTAGSDVSLVVGQRRRGPIPEKGMEALE